jgi:hypothetical protein
MAEQANEGDGRAGSRRPGPRAFELDIREYLEGDAQARAQFIARKTNEIKAEYPKELQARLIDYMKALLENAEKNPELLKEHGAVAACLLDDDGNPIVDIIKHDNRALLNIAYAIGYSTDQERDLFNEFIEMHERLHFHGADEENADRLAAEYLLRKYRGTPDYEAAVQVLQKLADYREKVHNDPNKDPEDVHGDGGSIRGVLKSETQEKSPGGGLKAIEGNYLQGQWKDAQLRGMTETPGVKLGPTLSPPAP